MANLEATYMGLSLRNPFVVGACSMTAHMDALKKMQDAGAGAVVIQSLFEEQILLEKYKMEEEIEMYDDWHAEMTNIFPDMEHSGPEEHLMWVQKSKEALDIPVIASLNCVNEETWATWAKRLEETGVDGLELNFFSIPLRFDQASNSIESDQVAALKAVKKAVKIPVSVKLSAFYTSPLEMMKQLEAAGVDGMVLFNRMFHPKFDIKKETAAYPFNLSSSNDHRLALRFVGLMAGNVKASLCGSHGIHTADDAVEMLLAGADVFQAVSTVYRNKLEVIGEIVKGIEEWMDSKGYSSLSDFRGKLSAKENPDRNSYRRAQYVKMLLHADDYIARPKLI